MNSPSNKHTPQKPKKPFEQKNSPHVNNKEFDQKVKRLTLRLSRQNICKEHKLITQMNLKLQVGLQHVLKLEQLRNLKLEDAIKLISNVPYLEWVNDKYTFGQIQNTDKMPSNSSKHTMTALSAHSGSEEKELLRFRYQNSDKIIILTGMSKIWAEAAIRQFNPNPSEHFMRPNSYKKNPSFNHHLTCEIIGVNDFWIAIEADTVQNALAFKKFIRQRKKAFQERRDFSFKEDKKRVRIVMQNEDFYTLLVDAMTQKKNIEFMRRLVNPNSGMFPSMCLRDTKKVAPFPNEEYQMGLKKINRVLYFPIISNRPQSKQADEHFTLEDVYSEDRSKTSEMFDSINSMNDLIEKADQGTQAESLGIGTHDEEIIADDLMNADQIALLEKYREHSPTKKDFERQNINQRRDDYTQCIKVPSSGKFQNLEKENDKFINKSQTNCHDEQSESDIEEHHVLLTNQNPQGLHAKNQNFDKQTSQKQHWQKPEQSHNNLKQVKELEPIALCFNNPMTLLSVREPQVPSKLLKFNFSVYSQTQAVELNYTKMKRLEAEYQKKSVNRLKLAPGIPEDFRQVSYEMRNKELFVQNLLKSMEKSSQKKQFALQY